MEADLITNNKEPLVSILITAYNAEDYLEYALDALISQTYQNMEIVIVDDGSIDSTPSIMTRKASEDKRIKVYFPGRLGRAKALNYGLNHCQGEYVAVNDADDYSKHDRIERQLAFMEVNPEVGLLGTAKEIHQGVKTWTDNVATEDHIIRELFAHGQPIQHSSAMFRRSLMEKVGGYNEKISFLLDRDIFLRIGRISRIQQLNDPLIILNRTENQYFKHRYKGFQRSWMSTKYQLKAVYYFGLSPLLYLNILIKFIYKNILIIIKAN